VVPRAVPMACRQPTTALAVPVVVVVEAVALQLPRVVPVVVR
jgi:hypothetical protein